MTLFLVLLISGLITYALRLSFIVGDRFLTLPQLARRALRFVPIAVLVAIIVPDVLLRDGTIAATPDNPRLIAALVATLVAWRTGNVLITIVIGMVVVVAWPLIVG